MRKLSTLLAAAAIATLAACGGSAEVPKDVDVDADVKTDTVPLPDVDVGTDTAKVTVPDVDVNMGGTDTTRRDTTRPPQP
ncbi:MAG TPA: hypothetical protein VFS08_07060 [Gemmatimonadaceae bacterium]|nr:hypothetical protein [Gemmatimonadaceae bacterium]